MSLSRALLSSEKQDYPTPLYIFEPLDKLLGFTLDVCATKANAKHPRFFSPEDNGLAQSWAGERCWMNPPYGDALPAWMRKARASCAPASFGMPASLVAALTPCRPDTEWWRKYVMQRDGFAGELLRSRYNARTGVQFFAWERLTVASFVYSGRITFEGERDPAPFPSALTIFAPAGSVLKPIVQPAAVADRLLEGWPS